MKASIRMEITMNNACLHIVTMNFIVAPGGGFEPPVDITGVYQTSNSQLDTVRQQLDTVPPPTSNNKINITAWVRFIEQIVNSEQFKEYVRGRYQRRDWRNFILRNAKLIPQVIKNPTLLSKMSYRKARAVLEAITPLRDFVKTMYNLELPIDTKVLRKHIPDKPVEEITNELLRFELLKDTKVAKDIVTQAVEIVKKMLSTNSVKYKLAVVAQFFTGLRGPEISFMFMMWLSRKKIIIPNTNTVLVELNYVRKKKRVYVTLMPMKLKKLLDMHLPIELSIYWVDDVREDYGINTSIIRKAWIAITARYLDDAERDFLQGRLSRIQVRNYIRHIIDIARRYEQAFTQFLELIPSQAA